MAILSSDGKYVTVQKGDTLWAIAEKYANGGINYKKLATINSIPNPDLIYINQKIYLSKDYLPGSSSGSGSSGSSSSTTSTSSSATKPTINQFGQLSTNENTLFATWSWGKESQTESYKVVWTYDTGDGVWFVGENQTISVDQDDYSLSRQATYSIPSNAKKVKFKVKPISKSKDDKGTTYWTASWSDVKSWTNSTPLEAPSAPAVTVDKYQLTASLENVNITGATKIEFEVIKDNSSSGKQTYTSNIAYGSASHVFKIVTGSEYKVRCRATNASKEYSEWSDYSSSVSTIPATPSNITLLKATSETSVYLEWSSANSAETYDIEYTTDKKYFDGSEETTVKSGIEYTHFELTGLESGSEYFFRVRAVNANGESGWSGIKSVIIGTKPAPPTTWSSTTRAVTGEELNLYWMHNTQDGSSQTYAILELYVDGEKSEIEVANSTDEDEKDKTSVYSINTSTYVEGTKIEWRVKTRGITNEYSDWSTQRTIDIYAPPTLELSVTDSDENEITTITEFPFYIYALAGPNTQTPIGYQLSVSSNELYETVDDLGNEKIVKAGEKIYSKYFDTTDALLVEMSAHNVNLDNNISYTITCSVTMDSGLTAEVEKEVTVTWSDISYVLDAEIGIDQDTLTAYIRPYCAEQSTNNYLVTIVSGNYVVGTETLGWMSGSRIPGVKTTTGEAVYSGVTADGDEVYYCSRTISTPIDNVYLSVYRREFDGSFTELAVDMDGAKSTTVTDPHPSLDYARYRLVAKTKDTGAVSFYDPPGYPVGGKAIVLQWDEEWTSFDTTEEAELEQPPWAGSMLKLPYNVDISDSTKPDVALVNYIGREHSTAYYGTHIGQTATWTTDVPMSDKDTLYALRRLSRWMGNVYVREPSGSGYWANVTVSFSQTHKEVKIPVTLTLTRVEGGA